MLRQTACKIARRAVAKSTPTLAARSFATEGAKSPTVVVPIIVDSLEWTLSSPPPLHQFDEPPLMVETDHLLNVNPGVDVEETLKAQGETVTEIEGAEAWAMEEYTPEKFEAWVKEQDDKFEAAQEAFEKEQKTKANLAKN
mmetsp:Transcript_41416/g.49689  ORF Transcript_41416/g.49689 Transcript_41416/m.49689 type:complete len:141 (+) Transcript_41416:53-475(+)|eukprot:CAMPEP_0194352568 /NCGR_PEP_ID=MMETSP0174-20130528/1001_1 /TAXON_ID=216777 /ORGANISM="Proboscia alata, Strain PI-D3" /LENGTH=140 /DNA_ID=CAMNT_0039120721 /DNA_START=32 /DNA_END=454 /DNA_ORIENTATION=+